MRAQRAGKMREREDATLAFVVGAHHEAEVLDRDDHRQRPEDQRQQAEHVVRLGALGADHVQALAQRVERARADVAEHDAERSHREQCQRTPVRAVLLGLRRFVLHFHRHSHAPESR